MLKGKITTIISMMLSVLLAHWGLAQSDDHTTYISIPDYIGLKIVDNLGNIGVNPSVNFDFATDVNSYLDAIDGSGVAQPTSVDNFVDLQVVTVDGFWYILTRSTPLNYTGPEAGVGLLLNDINVTRGAASGLVSDAVQNGGVIRPGWSLSRFWQWIVYDFDGTGGWRSLGFNGLDYSVDVNGDEDPGDYTTVVTFLLINP